MPSNFNFWDALFGGAVASILIPFTSYYLTRIIISWGIRVTLDRRTESNYNVINIRVRNSSMVTLQNVSAHITINNNEEDIIQVHRIRTFETTEIDALLLSWSFNLDGRNPSQINITSGQNPDLNVIRIHEIDENIILEVSSEQGFFDENSNSTSRTCLRGNRDYEIRFVLSGDNFKPIVRNYRYSSNERDIT